eukprot:scaffold8498_cov28-Tisochrysis_lutea.AAC.3
MSASLPPILTNGQSLADVLPQGSLLRSLPPKASPVPCHLPAWGAPREARRPPLRVVQIRSSRQSVLGSNGGALGPWYPSHEQRNHIKKEGRYV